MPGPTFHSLLTPTGSTTDLATYTTDTIDPLPNRLILISINCYIAAGSLQPPTPTVTGNGITYTLEKAQDIDNAGTDRSTLFVFRGMSSAPTKGAVSIAFGATQGNCSWNIDQSSADVDTSGTNGSGAIAQTTVGATSSVTVTTSPTTTFGSAMTTGNTAYFVCGIETNGPQTPRTNWTETGDVSTISLCGLEAQYRNVGTDTDGSSTWSTLARAGAVLMEIKSGATSPNGLVAVRASSVITSVNTLVGVRHTTPILGDIEILASASDSTQTLTIDALFTVISNTAKGSLDPYLGYNISDGTEVGDVSISSTATANRQVGLLATFRNYLGIEPSNIQVLSEPNTDQSHDSPSITPVWNGSCVVFVYFERTTNSTTTDTAASGLSTAVEFGTSGNGGCYIQIAYKAAGVVAGTPEAPGPWASLVATTAAQVVAFELIPPAVSGPHYQTTQYGGFF